MVKKGRWCEGTVFEAMSLMISFSMFIVTLLAYIDRINKRKSGRL
ncbi:putative holin-like toxin [Bariatricus sp. SGI.154]